MEHIRARRPTRNQLLVGSAVVMAALGAAIGALVTVSRGGAATVGAADRHPGATRSAPATTTTSTTTLPPDPNLTVVGYATGASVAVYPGPGAPTASMHLSSPNAVGAPLVFLVTDRQPGWDQVELPVRPNGSTGWVADADLTLYQDTFKVIVHLSAHTLDVMHEGQPVDHVAVADGSSASPTPPGTFYITELLKAPYPDGAYGPYAFGLSDFSNTYSEFEGGPGQIAIHGTNQPWLIGQSISHGCVRLADADLVRLVNEIPVGTPVAIKA